jgi:hypothetical protein
MEAALVVQLFRDWEYFLLYFSFFGLWEVTPEKESWIPDKPKRAFFAESITPSVFGVSIARILVETRDLLRWNLPGRRELQGEWNVLPGSPLPEGSITEFLEEMLRPKGSKPVIKVDTKPGDPFFLSFVPLFAEGVLQKTLPREGGKFVDGTYLFKVALTRDLWRRIEMSAKHTLLDLHHAIQDAFDFDDDHLYSFFMDGKPWSHERFTSPYEDEGPYVDEACVGELGLSVGQKFLYLFDYGDQWEFQVEVEDVRQEGKKPRRPKIVEERGKAPEQYPMYDEDDEEG